MPTWVKGSREWVARGRCNHEEAIVKKMGSKKNIIFFTFYAALKKTAPGDYKYILYKNLMNHFFVDVDGVSPLCKHLAWLEDNCPCHPRHWQTSAPFNPQGFGSKPPPSRDASHHQDDITCSVGNPYKPLLVTVTRWGIDASNNNFCVRKEMLTSWKFSDHHKIWSQKKSTS